MKEGKKQCKQITGNSLQCWIETDQNTMTENSRY